MSKYIDVEKLKTEIERELSALDKIEHLEAFEVGRAWNRGHRKALENILSIVNSLQQEQPSLSSNLNEAAEEYEDWVESYSQSDFPTCVSFRHAFKAGAEWMARQMKQEQPEVDLDFQTFAQEMDFVFNLPKDMTKNTEENPLNWEYAIARHFYELGLNARKEE